MDIHSDLFRYRNEEGVACYWDDVGQLANPERNTLRIHYGHLDKHSADLSYIVEVQFYK